jgi:Winged helix-turn-helix DNA-binding
MRMDTREGFQFVKNETFMSDKTGVYAQDSAEPKVWRAAAELHLDMLYALTRQLRCDADSVWVVMCVVAHALRPPVPGVAAAPGISRRMIADKTGLARETVRRRVTALMREGVLTEDAQGGVLPGRLAEPGQSSSFSTMLAEIERAVGGFLRSSNGA